MNQFYLFSKLLPLLLLGLNSTTIANGKTHVEKNTSQQVFLKDGKLVYSKDSEGNRIPDFSYVGYHNGERAIPDLPIKITLSPQKGDDTKRIQKALDDVGALKPNPQGHRGAILLKKGSYQIEGSLNLLHSGVVLRGEADGPGGTILIAMGYGDKKAKRTLINVGNRNRVVLDQNSKREIISDPVPIGSHRFEVSSTRGYQRGDSIVVYRPSTKEWISSIGCDKIPSKWTKVWDTEWVKEGNRSGFFYQRAGSSGRAFIPKNKDESWEAFKARLPISKDGKKYDTTVQWKAGTYDFYFERKIVSIEKNTITIDAPIVQPMEKKFGGGSIFKFTTQDRVQEIGIENLRIISEFDKPTEQHPYGDPKKSGSSELHGWNGVVLNSNTENTWVRNITGNYFGWSLVSAKGVKATITDCLNLGHASKIAGGRRYSFMISGQLNLVQRCVTIEGRHEFVNQARTAGPNVFVDCLGIKSKSSVGPHHRYAVGNLYDNIKSERTMESQNRGSSGSGHGWAGTQTIFYNCQAPSYKVGAPPGGVSWVIGSGKGLENRVQPDSLYYQQVFERLGQEALGRLTNEDQRSSLGSYNWAKERLKASKP